MSAVPAEARHYTNNMTCTKYRHGQCISWQRMTLRQARHEGYRVGYAFGPNYSYADFGTLPQPVVSRYRLRPNFRYVHENGRVYVVNPNTYRVVRVIPAI
jgi:hypothetical protein